MNAIEKAKLGADIAKLAAEIWGIWQDKRKASADRDQKIKDLEAELAKLKAAT